jgi:predicted RNase H-like HicB family nuclease
VTGYVVVIEEGPTSFGAWSPDLPGVVAAGETREECEALMREAIVFHIEGLIEDGDPVPPPSNATAVVFVDPAAA